MVQPVNQRTGMGAVLANHRCRARTVGYRPLGIVFEYLLRHASEQRAVEQQRRAFRAEAPTLSDAVLDSLTTQPGRLRDTFAPQKIERLAVNAMTALWGSAALVKDLFTELRELIAGTAERWRDVSATVNLTRWTGGPVSGPGSMFTATVRWAYKTIPAGPLLRFSCVSDPAEYDALTRDRSSALVWRWSQPAPLETGSPEVFELVSVTVDGQPCTVHRASRPDAQFYSVTLPTIPTGKEVAISYTYRVLVQRYGHLLWLGVPRLARGLRVGFRYDGAGISQATVLDHLASTTAPHIDQTAPSLPTQSVDLEYNGWIRPHAGVTFSWTLDEEVTTTPA